MPGKVCQTPAINQNGLLIIGVSALSDGEINEVAAIKIGDPNSSAPYWEITQAGGQNLGNTLGSPAIRCIAQGTTFVADMLGKVFRFDTGAAMMAGQWPTFQCGNRRAGKSATYPTAISDLGPFAGSYNSLTSVKSVDALGRVAGQAYGYYKYACGDSVTFGYSAALWENLGILNPGGCAFAAPYTFANALNAAGDVCGYGYGPVPLAWPDGVFGGTGSTTLSTPGYTSDMNTVSTIVGYAYSGTTVHTFRWQKSGSSWLPPDDLNLNSPSYFQCYAYSITEDGRIVGKATFTSGGPFHAFNTLANPGDLSSFALDLGTIGGTASEAWDMHETKGTVGRSQLSTGYWRAFYLPITAPTLGNSAIYEICGLPINRTDWSSAAYSVNKLGQVVGYAQIEQGQNLVNRAVLYDDRTGITTDLNDFALDGGQTPGGLGWTLTTAVSINDLGVMVGYGSNASGNTCWIIYPKCQD